MIITCANCGKKNRVPENHNQTGIFHCGACGHEIAEFAAHSNSSNPTNRTKPAKNKFKLPLVFGFVIAFGVCIAALCFLPHQITQTNEPTIQPPDASQASSGNPTPSSSVAPEITQPTQLASVQATLPPEDFSLPNGTELIHRRNRKSKGLIEISNGSDRDAVVKLVTDASRDYPFGQTYYKVYVRAGESTNLAHIKPNNYKVIFCAGRDWNKVEGKFNDDISFLKFDEPFPFEEKVNDSPDSTRTTYSKYTISLHGVYNGTARTSTVSQEEFDAPEDTSPE